jgi:uncharacterized protein YdeI (YjbR/CyaY-like superfamily)
VRAVFRRQSSGAVSWTFPARAIARWDAFRERPVKCRAEFEKLRKVLPGSRVTEDLNWGRPCYVFDGHKVALIHGFKDYCAIRFHNCALLKDPKGVLIQQTRTCRRPGRSDSRAFKI